MTFLSGAMKKCSRIYLVYYSHDKATVVYISTIQVGPVRPCVNALASSWNCDGSPPHMCGVISTDFKNPVEFTRARGPGYGRLNIIYEVFFTDCELSQKPFCLSTWTRHLHQPSHFCWRLPLIPLSYRIIHPGHSVRTPS